MIRGIHHVGVHVQNLGRMIEFYRSAFGFEVVGDVFSWTDSDTVDHIIGVPGSAARGAMLRAGASYMELFEFSAPAPQVVEPLRPSDKGYTHFCVDVVDIEQECRRLQQLGMTFDRPPVDAGHVKTIYGLDPEGHVIEIQETMPDCDFKLDDVSQLSEFEALRRLKGQYFYFLDTKQWDSWLALFTPDATLQWDSTPAIGGRDGQSSEKLSGIAAIKHRVIDELIDAARTVHHGHTPILELQSPNAATGIWAMEDIVDYPGLSQSLHAYGHYHETYRKIDGAWKFTSIHLTRLRVTMTSK